MSVQRMRIAVRHVCFIFWRALVKQIDKSWNQFCGDNNVVVKCVSFSTNTHYPFQVALSWQTLSLQWKKTIGEFSLESKREIPAEIKHACGLYARGDRLSVTACCSGVKSRANGKLQTAKNSNSENLWLHLNAVKVLMHMKAADCGNRLT